MPGLVYMYRHKLESLLDGRMENQKFACRFESGSYPFRSEVYNSKHYEVIYIISISKPAYCPEGQLLIQRGKLATLDCCSVGAGLHALLLACVGNIQSW